MRRLALAIALVVGLAGCADIQAAINAARAREAAAKQARYEAYIYRLQQNCIDFGYQPGTEALAGCVQQLVSTTIQAEAATRAARAPANKRFETKCKTRGNTTTCEATERVGEKPLLIWW